MSRRRGSRSISPGCAGSGCAARPVRRRLRDAAADRRAADLHVAGMASDIRARRRSCNRQRPRARHRRIAGLQRNRRALGSASGGDEEICLERAAHQRRQAVRRPSPGAAFDHRRIPGLGDKWQDRRAARQRGPRILSRQRRDRLPTVRRLAGPRGGGARDKLQRGRAGHRAASRRRHRDRPRPPDRAAGRGGVGSASIWATQGGSARSPSSC